MNRSNLQGVRVGDVVEYQRSSFTNTTCGTFQGWYSTDDGQVRLIVRNQSLGLDILVNPQRVMSISRQSEVVVVESLSDSSHFGR